MRAFMQALLDAPWEHCVPVWDAMPQAPPHKQWPALGPLLPLLHRILHLQTTCPSSRLSALRFGGAMNGQQARSVGIWI